MFFVVIIVLYFNLLSRVGMDFFLFHNQLEGRNINVYIWHSWYNGFMCSRHLVITSTQCKYLLALFDNWKKRFSVTFFLFSFTDLSNTFTYINFLLTSTNFWQLLLIFCTTFNWSCWQIVPSKFSRSNHIRDVYFWVV